MADLRSGVVRILRPDRKTAGTGFVVAGDLAVTCAHVLPAEAQPKDGQAGQDVELVFLAGGARSLASVVPEWVRPAEAEDVAFLQLREPLPEGVRALPLGSSGGASGHPFQTFGFPSASPEEGIRGDGHILGETLMQGMRVLQLSSPQITPGFSGAPVFDTATSRVVGMVNAIAPQDGYGRLAETAFIIPAETLRLICPRLVLSDIQPYLGLSAFKESDAEFFFGRRREMERLLDALRREPRFLAVLGPSGSGKSSVVQAGLIPKLRRGGLPGSDRWGIIISRPGDRPQENLQVRGLDCTGKELAEAVRVWRAKNPEKIRMVLVLDQFEELLATASLEKRQVFLGQLKELLATDLPITLLLIMRDDFFSRFAQEAPSDLFEWVQRGFVHISARLEEDELKEIIVGPAEKVGLQFEKGLAEVVVKEIMESTARGEMAGRSTILPLLEFALTELWMRRKDGELTSEAYYAIGGVTGSLTQWADHAYQSLAKEGLEDVVRHVLTKLVSLGDEKQGIPDSRRRRTLDDFGVDPAERDRARKVVTKLADFRLVVTSFDQQNKQETVEIIHDSLIREWERLRQWIRDNREFLVWERKISGWAGDWKETGPDYSMQRDKGMLLRTLNLQEADSWIKKRKHEIGPLILEYVQESLDLQEKERSFEDKMKYDNASLLARQSDLVLKGVKLGTSRSLLQSTKLALLSLEQKVTAEGVDALRSCLNIMPLPLENVSHEGDIFDISFSPDGRSMATASYDGTARIWDVTHGILLSEKFRSLKHGCAVNALAFSPDGQLLATAGDVDKKIHLWDLKDINKKNPCLSIANDYYVLSVAFSKIGNLLAWTQELTARIGELRRDDSGVSLGGPWELEHGFVPEGIELKAVSFSPDGLQLATAWEDGVVRVYDSHSGKFLFPLHPDTSLYSSIKKNSEVSEIWPDATFSPDGKSLALAWEKYAILWNIDNRREIRIIEHINRIHSVAFSPSGKELATAGLDQSVRVWDIASGDEIARLIHEDDLNSVAFSPTDRYKVATVASRIARLWDIRTFENFLEINKIGDVDLITCSKDGRLRATANNGKVNIFDLNLGKELELHLDKNVNNMSFSRDGSLLATAMDFTVQIWSSISGQRLITADEENYIYSIDFSPDGSQIAVASGREVILRDTATGYKIAGIREDEIIDRILFSPDRTQKILAAASCRSVRLYRVTNDSKIEIFWGEEFMARTIAFNFNGTQLSIASDKGIILLDVDKKILKDFRAEGNYFALVMSPNADIPCVAASSGRIIHAWDNEGNELARFDYNSDIRALEFSPDGRQIIITKSDDRTAKVWRWQVKDLISQAHNRLPQGFADWNI